MDKNKLKTVFLRKRKTLTEEEFDKRNAKLFYFFSQLLEEFTPKIVHTFLPIERLREVDTWIIVKYLNAMGFKVAIPKSAEKSNSLSHYLFLNKKQLAENKWGILEPIDGEIVAPDKMDIVLIPLVVFDKEGNRIGYGKGYYDNFLSQCRPDCIKIGLSLSPPLDKIQYMESHDIRLDYCISPVGVYRFNQ